MVELSSPADISRPLTYQLPAPFSNTSPDSPDAPVLVTQGAEALVFRTVFLLPSTPCALKYRPPKEYRHPILDKRLTRARILSEARVLVRCRRGGIDVPSVLALDADAGWLLTEWIPGPTVRDYLNTHRDRLDTAPDEIKSLMRRIGRSLGKMHELGVVHGDLTTSNLMLRTPASSISNPRAPAAGSESDTDGASSVSPDAEGLPGLAGDVTLIDFGLASHTVHDEDRAVDLYVLERAFSATHPAAEHLFGTVLSAYGESYRGAKVVLRRLEDVRARGRKRSLIG